MKPKSMALGNTLTLLKQVHGFQPPESDEWRYTERQDNRLSGRPRKIVRVTSTHVLLDTDGSMSALGYPKKTEYTEKGDTFTITTVIEKGNGSNFGCSNQMTYRWSAP